MASVPPLSRSASSRLTSASVSSMVPSARSTVIRPGSPRSTSRGTRTPCRVSLSWAALIPLAVASVAARSMVENRPVARWGRNGTSRTCTTGRRPRSYSRWRASVTRFSKTRAAAKSAPAPSRSTTTTAISSLRMRSPRVPRAGGLQPAPAGSAPGERRQQGQLGPVGDGGGRVSPALAVHQHARVSEDGHEAVAEAVAELVEDGLEGRRRRLHLWHPGRLPEGGEQSDPDHAAMVGCAAARCGRGGNQTRRRPGGRARLPDRPGRGGEGGPPRPGVPGPPRDHAAPRRGQHGRRGGQGARGGRRHPRPLPRPADRRRPPGRAGRDARGRAGRAPARLGGLRLPAPLGRAGRDRGPGAAAHPATGGGRPRRRHPRRRPGRRPRLLPGPPPEPAARPDLQGVRAAAVPGRPPRPGLDPGAAPPGGVGLRLLRRHPHRRRPRPPPPGQARPRARVDDRHRPRRRLQAATGGPGQGGTRSRRLAALKVPSGPVDYPYVRRAHGLRPMTVSPTLTKLARAHSGAMARRAAARYGGRCDRRALWHNDISKKAGRWVWLGQNVGCGTLGRDGVKASVRRIQNAFMSSPGHRRNILYPRATSFGASTWIAGPIIWVTVNFKQSPG